jgi:hypothetical protein
MVVHPSVVHGVGISVTDAQTGGQNAAAFRGRGAGAPTGYAGHKSGSGGPATTKGAARANVEEAVPSAVGRSSLLEEFRNNKNRKFTLQVRLPSFSALWGTPHVEVELLK